jgi:hypothetical protein
MKNSGLIIHAFVRGDEGALRSPDYRMHIARDRAVDKIETLVMKNKLINYFSPGLNSCTDTDFLLRFLRARKFDMTRTYDLLVKYYAVRNSYPEILNDLKPSLVKKCMDLGFTNILPGKCADGSRVVLFRPGRYTFSLASPLSMSMGKIIQFTEGSKSNISCCAQHLHDYAGYMTRGLHDAHRTCTQIFARNICATNYA